MLYSYSFSDGICVYVFEGPSCTNWNCTCDKQIRAKRATAALLGAMFLFSSERDNEELECCKSRILSYFPFSAFSHLSHSF